MATDNDVRHAQDLGRRGFPVVNAGANEEEHRMRTEMTDQAVRFDDDVGALCLETVDERGCTGQARVGSAEQECARRTRGQVTSGLRVHGRRQRFFDERHVNADCGVTMGGDFDGNPGLAHVGTEPALDELRLADTTAVPAHEDQRAAH